MIKGTYKFYIDNNLVAEQENALTVNGRTIAIKSLLGIIPNFAGTIAYGIGNKANTLDQTTKLISNNSLQFELGRTAVIGSSLDVSTNSDVLIYSATINDPYQYQIYEVGLFPSQVKNSNIGLAGSTIFDFDRVDLFNKFGSASGVFLANVIEARIGSSLLYLPPTDSASSYLTYITTDNTLSVLNSYTSQDTFRLSGLNTFQQSSSVVFRFYSDSVNYYDLIFPTPSASGYFISEIEKSAAGIFGTPAWDNITSVKIWQTSSSAIYLDGLRIDIGPYLIDTLFGMISRAVLIDPIKKPPGLPLTIEYCLALDFNGGLA